jgi:single-strand DNA-binding protein
MKASVVGNLTRDPELKFIDSGLAVVKFSVAENYKTKKGDDETYFWNVEAWGDLAEHIANSVAKGDRVFVEGRARTRSWKTDDDQTRTVVEIVADVVGPDLRFGTTSYTRAQAHGERSGNASPNSQIPFDDDSPF